MSNQRHSDPSVNSEGVRCSGPGAGDSDPLRFALHLTCSCAKPQLMPPIGWTLRAGAIFLSTWGLLPQPGASSQCGNRVPKASLQGIPGWPTSQGEGLWVSFISGSASLSPCTKGQLGKYYLPPPWKPDWHLSFWFLIVFFKALTRGKRDLAFPTRHGTCTPSLEAWYFNPWISRVVPTPVLFFFNFKNN